jgi:anti-sigma factor RsiW
MSGALKEETEREAIEDLLPWHAAGTLSRRDAQRVEAALAVDPELARRFEIVREELASTIHLNESLGAPSARAMDALFAKIDAEPVRRRALSLDIGARMSAFLESLSPRTLAWAGGAAALVIVLQAGLLGGGLMKPQTGGGQFQTASGPSTAPAQTGALVLLRFAPDATAADTTAFLEANHATIVDGPVTGGFYRVRVAAKALPKDKLAEVVKRLQAEKVVEFVSATR